MFGMDVSRLLPDGSERFSLDLCAEAGEEAAPLIKASHSVFTVPQM
jgi:hypothetical protein